MTAIGAVLQREFLMARKKKIRRKVTHRFVGIDRSLSKSVYALESRHALLQRETGSKNGGGEILKIYRGLSAGGKRNLLRIARALKST